MAKAGVFLKLDKSKLAQPFATWIPTSWAAWPPTIRAMSTQFTTCGARPASATTPRWSGKRLAPTGSTAGTRCSTRRLPRSSRSAESRCWTRQKTSSMVARIYLGRDPEQRDAAEDLAAAESLLKQVRPYVRYFDSDAARERPGERRSLRCVQLERLTSSRRGTAAHAAATARRSRVYVIPKEGVATLVRHGRHSG